MSPVASIANANMRKKTGLRICPPSHGLIDSGGLRDGEREGERGRGGRLMPPSRTAHSPPVSSPRRS